MKFMIPFLMAAILPVAGAGQAQSGAQSAGQSSVQTESQSQSGTQGQSGAKSGGGSVIPRAAIPKTTEVLVIETVKQGVTPAQVMAVIPDEIQATVKLYLDGKIRQWFSRGDGKGVVFLVDAKSEEEARAIMEALPLAKEHLMDHQYIPVGPLMPLRALNPAAFQ